MLIDFWLDWWGLIEHQFLTVWALSELKTIGDIVLHKVLQDLRWLKRAILFHHCTVLLMQLRQRWTMRVGCCSCSLHISMRFFHLLRSRFAGLFFIFDAADDCSGSHHLLCWQGRCLIISESLISYVTRHRPILDWVGERADLVHRVLLLHEHLIWCLIVARTYWTEIMSWCVIFLANLFNRQGDRVHSLEVIDLFLLRWWQWML